MTGKRELYKAIKTFCIKSCKDGVELRMRKCDDKNCELWKYRTGRGPKVEKEKQPMPEPMRIAMEKRLAELKARGLDAFGNPIDG